MNMHAKPELFVPAFTGFNVAKIEVDADMVRFTLKYGCVEIDCEMLANELSDSIFVEPQFEPEHGRDMPYTKLEVDDCTPVTVIRTDADLVDGQKIKLTEQQVEKLNQQLEWICVEKFEQKLEKVA